MKTFKFKVSDKEIRWVNLDAISRVTYAVDDKELPLLVIYFGTPDHETCMKIHGSDAIYLEQIASFTALMDQLDQQ